MGCIGGRDWFTNKEPFPFWIGQALNGFFKDILIFGFYLHNNDFLYPKLLLN